LAAAVAAVPAIAAATGAGGDDEATRLLTAGLGAAEATRILPSAAEAAAGPAPTGATAAPAATTPRRRSPWTWPLVALIVILVIVLGGTVWALLNSQQAASTPTQTTTSAVATPTPTETRIDVDALALKGLDCQAAVQKAKHAGILTVSVSPTRPVAPDAASVDTVESVNPQGKITPATELTLTCYGEQASMPDPDAPTLPASVEAGGTADLMWPNYTCPAGGQVASYDFTVTNGTFDATGSTTAQFQAGDRPASITVTGDGGQLLTVSYTVTCTVSGSDLTSASSAADAHITATATPTATTEPDEDSP
ncbi:MAG: serine/threonine protein kinase, partial [Microbacterium sp.]